MILLNQDTLNDAVATCSVNKQLHNPTYLWSMRHKLTNQTWRFIPYKIPPAVSYNPSYDKFTIDIDFNNPEVFIGVSSGNTANLHFISGDYFVKIYEQSSPSNLNPQYSFDVVYETTARVMDTSNNNPTELVSYSANTDVFTIYRG